jgi:hypothetical protein
MLLLDMAGQRLISALGSGSTAVYAISDDQADVVRTAEDSLTGPEADALRRATQRSNAIFDAWAKASATWAPSADSVATAGQARRQALT